MSAKVQGDRSGSRSNLEEHRRSLQSKSVATSDEPNKEETLLFTDIEGSTQLVELLGDHYPKVLERHFELLRQATSNADGREINVHGDAFFAVFQCPEQAVAAAIAAQRSLSEQDWPEDARVRVRMGIHCGKPQRITTPEIDYVGIDVHRAARICNVAHGGQIILSEATCLRIERHLPAGVSLRDLGTHRLKDIRFPEKLFDLLIDGLPSHFEPLRSLDNRPNNLPTTLTPFIGRIADKEALQSILTDHDVRIVSLTGPGGSGKTRLSIEVARGVLEVFTDGVFFIPLAAVKVPRLVPPTIAQTLGVAEISGRPILDLVKKSIGPRKVLLVLDNFEQVLRAESMLVDLLNDCPHLKLMVTSREALNVPIGREYPVLPLHLPALKSNPDLQTLLTSDAVQFFIDRARAVRPDFELTAANATAVTQLCERLDGLPLAIELAASRLRLMDPGNLLKRVTKGLDALGHDDSAENTRHHTMRNAIAWSYDLLEESEQRLFCYASVFAGGCSLDSAELLFKDQMEGADLIESLTSLVRKSLMKRDTVEGEARLTMLETIREFGREQLKESGQLNKVRELHMNHMLELAERMAPDLATRKQRRSLGKLLIEADNIRAALEFALEHRDGDIISRFLNALLWLWISRSQFTEAESWIGRALVRTDQLAGKRERAVVTDSAGWLKLISGDWAGALPYFQESLRIYEGLGLVRETAMAMMLEGIIRIVTADDASASHRVLEALAKFRELHDQTGIGLTLTALGEGSRLAGDFSKAEAYFVEALQCMRSIDNTYWTVALLENLSHTKLEHGDWASAANFLKEALELGADYEDPMLVNNYFAAMAHVALVRDQPEDAARLFGATEAFLKWAGVKFAPADQKAFERNMEIARTRLGAQAFGRLFEQGGLWSVAEALGASLRLHPESESIAAHD